MTPEEPDEALGRLAQRVRTLAATRRPFILGVTGSVASGKSSLARALSAALRDDPGQAGVALIGTDGFLFPHALLEARGLEARKGFPESYDLTALGRALEALRSGPVEIPVYSHAIYDIEPEQRRRVDPEDIVIVEGLGLGLSGTAHALEGPDRLVFIDADEDDLERWYIDRFLGFWAAAEHDEASFYRRFRHLDREGATDMARMVWRGVNLPNLREHIAPLRAGADFVLRKGSDHQIVGLEDRTR